MNSKKREKFWIWIQRCAHLPFSGWLAGLTDGTTQREESSPTSFPESLIEFLQKELEKPEKQQDKQRLFIIIESLMEIGDKRALESLGILHKSCNDEELKGMTENAMGCIDPNWKNTIKKLKSK